jgi:type I site-specific restriction endonuclease
MTPEEKALRQIDAMLVASGWVVQTKATINLSAQRGAAICELSFATGEPDYTLFVDGKAIVTDECHRSIYNLWRPVLDYFDASLIGLTATPSKQTSGFFQQNLVMEYNHEKAVADGVNVGCDIYRIKTPITEGGSKVEAGLWVDKRDRQTRKVRWEQLDEVLAYDAGQIKPGELHEPLALH